MNTITVVDACMGRGKTSAVIRYMNEHKSEKRFMYITPFLTEVDRICSGCGFTQPAQPEDDTSSKSIELKILLRDGTNVAITHSLFYLLDDEGLEIIRNKHYTLVVDESVCFIRKCDLTPNDTKLICSSLATVDENGRVVWKDNIYTGKFSEEKALALSGSLYRSGNTLLCVTHPNIVTSFDDIIILTYLFGGQYQKTYFEHFGFEYRIVGVEKDEKGFFISDKPDCPPPMDYRSLINIVDNPRMNGVGQERNALSKNWYRARRQDSLEIVALRKGMHNFFGNMTDSTSGTRLWTCYKDDIDKLTGKSGRYRGSFLQIGARATNEYKDRTDIAYMVNRFVDPMVKNVFGEKAANISQEDFALGEMLQWIWRSAIRDGKPINLYLPSARMRSLLTDWIDKMEKGATTDEKSAEMV